jgi:hypothetical protein
MTAKKKPLTTERDRWLQVRASSAEIKQWTDIANERGLTLSAWVRMVLIAEGKK